MILIVIALPSEAKPFCERHKLKLRCERPFKVFQNEKMAVILSGVGVESSAAAVGFLGGLFDREQCHVWFNVGIAGHQRFEIGTVVMAHKISRWGDDRNWFPDFAVKPPFPTAEIMSCNKAVNDFPDNYVCDMESAGFMAAVEKFAPPHLTQVIKVVSDNEKSGTSHVNKKFVSALIEQSLGKIQCVIDEIKDFDCDLGDSAISDQQRLIQSRWRFTVSQSLQLQRELRRFSALSDGRAPETRDLNNCRTAREVINIIRKMANTNAPELGF